MYAWACPVCGFWQADARYEQHVCKQAKNYRPDLYGPKTDVNERGYGWHDPKPSPADGHAFDSTSNLLACCICQCSKGLHEPVEKGSSSVSAPARVQSREH